MAVLPLELADDSLRPLGGVETIENSSNRRGEWTGPECLFAESGDFSKSPAFRRRHLTDNTGRCLALGIANRHVIAVGNTFEEGLGFAIVFIGQVDIRLPSACRDEQQQQSGYRQN